MHPGGLVKFLLTDTMISARINSPTGTITLAGGLHSGTDQRAYTLSLRLGLWPVVRVGWGDGGAGWVGAGRGAVVNYYTESHSRGRGGPAQVTHTRTGA